jgi:hypothetical protein
MHMMNVSSSVDIRCHEDVVTPAVLTPELTRVTAIQVSGFTNLQTTIGIHRNPSTMTPCYCTSAARACSRSISHAVFLLKYTSVVCYQSMASCSRQLLLQDPLISSRSEGDQQQHRHPGGTLQNTMNMIGEILGDLVVSEDPTAIDVAAFCNSG